MTTLPRTSHLAVVLGATLIAISACARTAESMFTIGAHQYSPADAIHLKLPKALREVSGLALDDDERLYTHDDERGIVYRIDYEAGRIIERFALKGGVKADFEGIAYAAGRLYLITSEGHLFETRVGAAEEMVPFRRHSAGLDCEVEGLTRAADGKSLLAACKTLADGGRDVHIYQWYPEDQSWSNDPQIRIHEAQWRTLFESQNLKAPKKIQPTGLTMLPNGNLLLIAGRQHLLLEFTQNGDPLAVARLPKEPHRQAEGLAITRDGRLLIADEGNNRGGNKSRGTLSIYEPVR